MTSRIALSSHLADPEAYPPHWLHPHTHLAGVARIGLAQHTMPISRDDLAAGQRREDVLLELLLAGRLGPDFRDKLVEPPHDLLRG